jgi:hypothetical protein
MSHRYYMPTFDLQVSCAVAKIAALAVPSGYSWQLTLGCGSCTARTSPVSFCAEDQVEIKGDKSAANFLMTCRDCERSFNVTVLSTKELIADDGQISGCLACFECRNCAPETFLPTNLTARSESGAEFPGLALDEDFF